MASFFSHFFPPLIPFRSLAYLKAGLHMMYTFVPYECEIHINILVFCILRTFNLCIESHHTRARTHTHTHITYISKWQSYKWITLWITFWNNTECDFPNHHGSSGLNENLMYEKEKGKGKRKQTIPYFEIKMKTFLLFVSSLLFFVIEISQYTI